MPRDRSSCPPRPLRIGLLAVAGRDWLGGVNYLINIAGAVSLLDEARRPRLWLLILEDRLEDLELYRDMASLVEAVVVLGENARPPGTLLGRPALASANLRTVIEEHVDVVYPMDANSNWEVFIRRNVIPWIPDLQHRLLPEYSPPQEIAGRDQSYERIARHARLAVFSSHSAVADFRRFYPYAACATRVLAFHVPQPDLTASRPLEAQAAFGLPDRFLLCSNQFWKHKDHATAFNALAILARAGMGVTLACTGRTHDPRNPEYFDGLSRRIEELGLTDSVRVLGVIGRGDQLALMRRAMAVVQPSLFEGWSTVVEDARALGKTLFLSDIAPHVEQNPPGAVYFPAGNAKALAEALAEHLPGLSPGPDAAAERAAAVHCLELRRRFAGTFVDIAEEATRLYLESSGHG